MLSNSYFVQPKLNSFLFNLHNILTNALQGGSYIYKLKLECIVWVLIDHQI